VCSGYWYKIEKKTDNISILFIRKVDEKHLSGQVMFASDRNRIASACKAEVEKWFERKTTNRQKLLKNCFIYQIWARNSSFQQVRSMFCKDTL
jgi:hypothetical protein